MGALASKNGAKHFDDYIGFDLGPQHVASILENSVYSLESLQMPGHYVRHRGSELWIDEAETVLTELYAFDASFVIVPGLLGFASSLRSANFPLEYIRQQDPKVCIGEYDGSESFRNDATFEFREFEDTEGLRRPTDVCITLASNPGKYFCIDKNKRLVLERYQHVNRAAYKFRLITGLAVSWDREIGAPLCSDVASKPSPEEYRGIHQGETGRRIERDIEETRGWITFDHLKPNPERAPPELSDAYRRRRLQLPVPTRTNVDAARPLVTAPKAIDFEVVD